MNKKKKNKAQPLETPLTVDSDDDNEGLYEFANISPRRTGLPFVVWISPQFGATHDVRVMISSGPIVHSRSELIPVAIRPTVHVVGDGEMSTHDLDLLKKWIALNFDTLIKYWNGEIDDAGDAIAAVKSIRS